MAVAKKQLISVVVPVLNESENIPILYEDLKKNLGKSYEIIFVNDGSTDDSGEVIEKIQRKDKRIKLITLSRNFGHQVAITCGMDFAKGDAAVIIDADLQDPPSLIPKMIVKWQQGFDVVYGVRKSRDGESFFKIATANAFYKLINVLSGTRIPQNVGDFRLVSKEVLDHLRESREHQRFLRGLITWMGFSQTGVEYVRSKRRWGKSKYSVLSMIRLARDAIFSFSFIPLRIASILGLVTVIAAIVYIFYAIYINSQGETIRGWSSIVVIVLFLGSVELIAIGIIGEYLARIYDEVRRRPLYVIKQTSGLVAKKNRKN